MIDEVWTEPSYLQTLTTDETTLSHNIDGHLFAYVNDIFHTTHNCNSDS